MNFKIDNLQYCNWSREIFQSNRDANLDAVHVTIVYHEDYDELLAEIKKWEKLFLENSDLIFLGKDFISVNKNDEIKWDEIKHIVISLINDFYSDGKEFVIDENAEQSDDNLDEIEQKIVKILDQKIRPAVARDGGDIKFKEFKDGVVKVQLQGSCSGCPSSTMTLKQGVQNLLCHYLPEVKEVIAI